MLVNYIIIEREFLVSDQDVYKIGHTKDIKQRITQYPKGSEILWVSYSPYMILAENTAVKVFSIIFKHRSDLGREYFQGNLVSMMEMFKCIINHYNSLSQGVLAREEEQLKSEKELGKAKLTIKKYLNMHYLFNKHIKIYNDQCFEKKKDKKVQQFINDNVKNNVDRYIRVKKLKHAWNLLNSDFKIIKYEDFHKYFVKYLGTPVISNGEWIFLNKEITILNKEYLCACGSSYDHKQSLSKHGKKCDIYKDRKEKKLSLNILPSDRIDMPE